VRKHGPISSQTIANSQKVAKGKPNGFAMTEERKTPQPEVPSDADALYTENYARERARKSRRNSLIFGVGAMVYGSLVVHDAVIAFRTGELVELGGRHRNGLELPPLLAGPIGVIAIIGGLWLLTALIFRRK
jgi:hypothetical protein